MRRETPASLPSLPATCTPPRRPRTRPAVTSHSSLPVLRPEPGKPADERAAEARAYPDQALAERARQGDAAAIGELLEKHGRRVHGRLYRLLGASAELDDLVQQTFVEAIRSLAGFRGDSSFATWLDRITCRVAYRSVPQRRSVSLESVPDPVDETLDPHEKLRARETCFRLSRLLDRLTPKKRTAFVLHAVEGKPTREVAELVGANLATVKSRIWFARRELERAVRRDPYFAELIGYLERPR